MIEHNAMVSATRDFWLSARPKRTPTAYAALTNVDAATHGTMGSRWMTARFTVLTPA
jgi:hypothetical protein